MKKPKYCIGDILHHREDNSIKRVVLFIWDIFYDETGISQEVYYQTNTLENTVPPCPMKESDIDKYYILCDNGLTSRH